MIRRKITIEEHGDKTVAKFYCNDKLVRTRVACCNPNDNFDFAIGAKLALERLFEKIDWNAFKNTNLGIIVNKCNFKSFINECGEHGMFFNPSKDFNPFDVEMPFFIRLMLSLARENGETVLDNEFVILFEDNSLSFSPVVPNMKTIKYEAV